MNSEPDPRAAQPNQSVWARTTTEAAEEDEENSPSNPKPRITDNTDEQMPFAVKVLRRDRRFQRGVVRMRKFHSRSFAVQESRPFALEILSSLYNRA